MNGKGCGWLSIHNCDCALCVVVCGNVVRGKFRSGCATKPASSIRDNNNNINDKRAPEVMREDAAVYVTCVDDFKLNVSGNLMWLAGVW